MITEKKIEEAAKLYAWNNRSDEGGEEDILDKKRAFRSGINWFLDNLWHDASEEPKENIDILVEYLYDNDRKFVKLGFHKPSFYPWQQKIINERITRWLYIDDLRKGGTHE